MTLEIPKKDDEGMRCRESEYLPKYVCPSTKRRHDLFEWWMDNLEWLEDYVFDKPTDMDVNGEGQYYMDEDPRVLMLKEEGTH